MKALKHNLLLQFNILCFIIMLLIAIVMGVLVRKDIQHQNYLLNKITLEMSMMDMGNTSHTSVPIESISAESGMHDMHSMHDMSTMPITHEAHEVPNTNQSSHTGHTQEINDVELSHTQNTHTSASSEVVDDQHANHTIHSATNNSLNETMSSNLHSTTLNEIQTHTANLQSKTLLTLILGFVLLYFALVSIVWRGWRIINGQQLRFQGLVESMREGLLMTTSNNKISYANSRMYELLGLDSDQIIGKNIDDVFSKKSLKQSSFEEELKTESNVVWLDVKSNPYKLLNGKSSGSIYTANDISDKKRVEEQMQYNAFHDVLTKTPNRALFLDRLKNAIDRYHRDTKNAYAVLFLDFDRFKVVNDSLGHAVGDTLLKAISKRLQGHLKRGDTLARLGGDEFTILLEDIKSSKDVTEIAERIQTSLQKPFKIDQHIIHISASIGIVTNDLNYHAPEDVVRDADIAMYRAKALGKARFEMFTEEMRQSAAKLLVLENDLRTALQEDQLTIHYQPIAELLEDNVVGFEALARWQHPVEGLISPAEFIPVAEDTGLIIELDRWILRNACIQVAEWQNELNYRPPITLSVNFSSRQFDTNDLVPYLSSVLEETGFNPPDLKIEITEQIFMANSDNVEKTLHELKNLGVKLYIDDFGTGYSSLSYLQRFPVDTLKIDRCFITNMIEDSESSELVRAIISMAHNLGLQVVAEGIETQDQMQQLKNYNCDYMQGFHLSKPLSLENAREFLITQVGRLQYNHLESLPPTIEVLDDTTIHN